MENKIKLFENKELGQLNILESEEHGFLFIGYEVATMAGYKSPNAAITNLANKYKVKLSYDEVTELFSNLQNNVSYKISPNGLVMVNEPGLYKLASGKNQKFENWIFFDVLPSIRKTGTYQLESRINQQLETTLHGLKILTGIEPEEMAIKQNESWRAKLANLINDIAKREKLSTQTLYEKLYFLFASETGFHIPDLAKAENVSNVTYLKNHELSAKMLYEFALGYFYRDKRFVDIIQLTPDQSYLDEFKQESK